MNATLHFFHGSGAIRDSLRSTPEFGRIVLRLLTGNASSASSSGAGAGAVVVISPSAQQKSWFWDYIPHPYLYCGPGLMGGGYAPVVALIGGGVRIDLDRLSFDAHGSYEMVTKQMMEHSRIQKGTTAA